MNDTCWDIQEALKHENLAGKYLNVSIKQWQDVAKELSADVTNLTTSGLEWKVRYECQHLYNRMLIKQIQRMRAEIRMLRSGLDIPSDDVFKTVGEWRRQIRNLQVEKVSLISLREMYERQLDQESMGYYRSRDQLYQVTKDMKNSRESWIREQEKADSELMSLNAVNPHRKLKPVAKIHPIKVPVRKRRDTSCYVNMYAHNRGSNSGPDAALVQQKSDCRHLSDIDEK